MKRSTTLLWIILLLSLCHNMASAQRITVTIGGNGFAGSSGDNGPARQARINGAQYICSDPAANIYFVDGIHIRKISAKTGIITTIAGGGVSTLDGIPATNASITPVHICANAIGDIFLVTGAKIKKIDALTNIITTFAGTGTYGFGGDSGPATAALFNGINGICADAIGNIYVADKNNNRIRKIAIGTGIVTTIAGVASSGYTGDGGLAVFAALSSPTYICTDPLGAIYFSDQSDQYIRRIDAVTNVISTYAGGSGPVMDCMATSVTLGPLSGISFDASYNFCFNELSCSCRKIDHVTDSVKYIGGDFGTESFKDDTNSLYAWMNTQQGITSDAKDNIYIADHGNNRIRKLVKLTPAPVFAYGQSQSINPCPGYPFILNSQMAVADLDMAQPETWSIVTPPSVGALSRFPTTLLSNGVNKLATPSGLSYAAPSTYSGTDSFTIRVSDGTYADTVLMYVSVQAAAPAVLTGKTAVCTGSTTTLSTSVPGGVWSCSNSNLGIDPATGYITGITAGMDTIMYNMVTPCALVTTVAFSVNPTPAPGTISGADTVCKGANTTLLATVPGGTWSSPYSYATVGSTSGIVTGVSYSYSPYLITYTVNNAWCSSTATKNMFVNTVVTSISGTASLCTGSTGTFTSYPGGGAWSLKGGKAIVVSTPSNYADIRGVSTGLDTIVYTNTNTCGSATVTKTLTLTPGPAIGTISGPTSVCAGGTISLTNSVPGGTWDDVAGYAAIVDYTTGVVTGYYAGTDSIVYKVSSSPSCYATASVLINVGAAPALMPITGSSSVCAGATIKLADATLGGAWTVSNPNATVSGSGLVTGITAGADSVIYSLSSSCGIVSTIKLVTVNAAPLPGAITGPSSICPGASVTVTDIAPGGVWSFSTSDASISGLGVVTGVSAGTGLISYKVVNSCGTAYATYPFTVDPVPVAGVITGSSRVCEEAAIALTDAATGGAWSVSNPNITVSGSGIVKGITAGTASVIYTVTNACGVATATTLVTIDPAPDAGAITGPSSVCDRSSITLADVAMGGSWLASNVNASVSASGVVKGSKPGMDTILYMVVNSCGADTATLLVKINDCATTGAPSALADQSIRIYPNPTSSIVNIEWPGMPITHADITLTDAVGRIVFKGDFINDGTAKKQVDLSGVVEGVYVIRVGSDAVSYTSKLVVAPR